MGLTLLNINNNTPFFPFSTSDENDSFSIALETTEKVVEVIEQRVDDNYSLLKDRIVAGLTDDVLLVEKVSNNISKNNIIYQGQDISLSPYQDEDISVVNILNLLGLANFGSNGTQFLTAFLTSILKDVLASSNVKSVGFNGVMYSLLEDKIMCKSNETENFTIDSIMLYSTVCGCGLDMVPVPGDISEEEIGSMILDVAATSIKLNKPLGFRILPIIGKRERES